MKILLALLFLTFTLFASIGKIISYNGDVTVLREGKLFHTKIGFSLSKKDIINTAKHSKVKIYLNDNTRITMGQNAKLSIAEYLLSEKKPSRSKANFKFLKGAFSVITGKIGKVATKRFKLHTKTATIGIRGTIIVGNQREVACTKGSIDVSSQGKTVNVPAGMITQTLPGHAPTTPQAYSTEELDSIDSGSSHSSYAAYQNINQEQQAGTTQELQEDASGYGGRAQNIVIDSNVKNASNVVAGSLNKAEQNIHSIAVKGGEVEYIYIRGKAYDVKNVATGIRNTAKQNIGSINVK